MTVQFKPFHTPLTPKRGQGSINKLSQRVGISNQGELNVE